MRTGHGDRRLVPPRVRRPLLHRNPEQRPGDPAAGDGRGRRSRPADGACRWWPPATPTTSTARTPKPRTCCCASTPASSAPTRTGCGWKATSSSSAARRKCTRPSPASKTRSPKASRSPTASTSSWSWASGISRPLHAAGRKNRRTIICASCARPACDRYAERSAGVEMRPTGQLSDEVRQRLERELDVINKLGFPNYFLIVWDFVRYVARAEAFRPRPAARASARWFATRCI